MHSLALLEQCAAGSAALVPPPPRRHCFGRIQNKVRDTCRIILRKPVLLWRPDPRYGISGTKRLVLFPWRRKHLRQRLQKIAEPRLVTSDCGISTGLFRT